MIPPAPMIVRASFACFLCTSMAFATRGQDVGVGRRTGLGTNLSGVGSIATQWDFADLMKGSNPWVFDGGPQAGQPTPVDAMGNPLLAPGEKANTLLRLKIVNASQNRVPDYPTGEYTISWEGTGQFILTGDGDFESITAAGPGTRTFTAATGAETLFMRIDSSSQSDPLRNIRVYMPGYAPGQANASQVFHSEFVDRSVKPFGSMRFMDWNAVNGTTISQWSQRTPVGTNQYTLGTGIPLEQQLRLVNQAAGDAWFTLPAHADDDFVRRFAKATLYGLDAAGEPYDSPQASPVFAPVSADRKVFVEYANEVWNGQFEGFQYVTQQAIAAGLNPQGLDEDFAKQWAVETRRDFDIWTDVYATGGELSRLRRVAAIQTSNRFISPIYLNEMVVDEVPQFDVIAPAFYVGVDTSSYNASTTKDNIIDDLYANLANEVDPQIISFLPGTPFEVVGPRGNWLLWKQFADQYGVDMIAYEGGQHITTPNTSVSWYDDYLAAQRDSRMYEFYSTWLDTIFNNVEADGVSIFSSVGLISQFGAWGLLEYQDQPLDDAPKYHAVVDFARDSGDFDLNGWYNATDIDLLRAAAGMAPTGDNAAFDLDGDGVIDESDVLYFLEQRLDTTLGDVNLDGSADSADLARWNAGYGIASSWIDGDADGDGDVDGRDFLIWQRNVTNAAAVATQQTIPEPGGMGLLSCLLALLTPSRSTRFVRRRLPMAGQIG